MAALTLDDIVRTWNDARTAIVEETPVDASYERLDALRLAGARATHHLRVPAFVAACALRLAIIDALPETPAITPATQKEAREMIRTAGRCWNQGAALDWNSVAYAVCFATDEEVTIDEHFLSICADFDADCTHRARLRALLATATEKPADARREAFAAWAARMTKGASDDVYALARESAAWAFMTPEAERKGQGAWATKLGDWDPERAAEAFSQPPHVSAHQLLLFDCAMRQMLGVRFLHLFFAHDYASEKALEKVEAFKNERLRKPPPLLVHSMGEWYLLHKHPDAPAVRCIERYCESADALMAWMDAVNAERGGIVFMGKSILGLFQDTTRLVELADDVLRARTVEIL